MSSPHTPHLIGVAHSHASTPADDRRFKPLAFQSSAESGLKGWPRSEPLEARFRPPLAGADIAGCRVGALVAYALLNAIGGLIERACCGGIAPSACAARLSPVSGENGKS
jgi:hypothetical protein